MAFAMVLTNEPRVERRHCCDDMTWQANMLSSTAEGALLASTDKRVYWSPVFDEYGLICQPSAEVLKISHCPFCGTELPASKRAAWFGALERTGWRTWGDPIADEMLSDGWSDLTRRSSGPLRGR